jgi:tetratricopeptide (TPR) repeat protein
MLDETAEAAEAPAKDAPSRKLPRWLLPLAIAVATCAVYANTLRFDFVYDDYAQIVETKQLNSWHMIPHYFTGHVWQWKSPNAAGPYYRPVFLLWLLLNQTLFETVAPWWHLTSVLTHVATTLLLFFFAARLTGSRFAAGIAALFFGLHPAHVEDVDWVSSVTEPLMAVCVLGSLLCYLRRSRAASLVLFTIGLFEKETALAVPPLIFAWEWLVGQRDDRSGWAQRLRASLAAALPYLAITIVYLGIRLQVLHQLSMVITPIPRRVMIFTWPSMLLFYLQHLVWPRGLSVFYMLPLQSRPDFIHFAVPCLLLGAVCAALWLWHRRKPVVGFAAALLALPILPVLNIRAFGHNETVHDRYLYLPSAGFCLLIGMALAAIARNPRPWVRPAVVAITLAIAAGFSYGTIDEGQYWENNVALFGRGLEISPDNEIANQCMGTALLLRGQFADSIPFYRRALQLEPKMPEAAYSLGRSYYELGMYKEADPYFALASRLRPSDAKDYLYYGLSQMQQGHLDIAERSLRHAMTVKGPDDYREYHLGLGLVLESKGDLTGAAAEFKAEANENPDPTKALEELAKVKDKLAGHQ